MVRGHGKELTTPITHILPYTLVKRRRVLPREGRVSVRQGQTVRATDVIATAVLEPRHTMLDVAAGLGVTRCGLRGPSRSAP